MVLYKFCIIIIIFLRFIIGMQTSIEHLYTEMHKKLA